jgi:hypothetical protein
MRMTRSASCSLRSALLGYIFGYCLIESEGLPEALTGSLGEQIRVAGSDH